MLQRRPPLGVAADGVPNQLRRRCGKVAVEDLPHHDKAVLDELTALLRREDLHDHTS
jgi:hypothetical protein